ncbi:MAG: hypothetical protein EXR71_06895 [Myxococcales bacterium]|nr:hypothetical protein [Myxococcales bacterium]
MTRVEVAINEGRCVLVFGSRVLADAETLGELRRRNAVPAVVLGGETPSPALKLDSKALAPALTREGGLLCLIDADGLDSLGLGQLADAVSGAAHKPRLVVVARNFNPFALPSALRTLKFDHQKLKARDFLFTLPVPAPVAPVAVLAVADAKKKAGAPKIAFVGREDELAWLAERTEGPAVVAGPSGIGKRWLVEKALAGCTNRIPDFIVGWGSEADALYARIAALAADAGDKRLAVALTTPADRPVPSALAALAVESLRDIDATLVIDRLDAVMRRDGTFHRESRFELLVRALLVGKYKARVLFLSTVRPRFYREGEGLELPVLELAGLKGKDLHEIFDAYRVEDFARDNFGLVNQRIHGHPLAARLFAVAVRDPDTREELMESNKFLAMDSVADLDAPRRRIEKTIRELTEDERHDLALFAHFRRPFTAGDAEILRVKRESRLNLLGKGLIEMVPDEGRERTFYVHRLVAGQLPVRETSLYDLLEALGDQYVAASVKEKGQAQLALAQEGNRLLYEAHRTRNRARMSYPDHDGALESIRGMVRSKKPHFELAEQRIAEVLKLDPGNTEVALLGCELMAEKNCKGAEIAAVYQELAGRAPTPEVFHLECNFCEKRGGGPNRAIAALERGVGAFPDNARMKRRLAGLLVDAGRREPAAELLKAALDLEPMMPDSYGLLGEAYYGMGPDYWGAARDALAEARRLDPTNTLHMARLGALLIESSAGDGAVLDEAQTLLEDALQTDKKNYPAHLLLGRLLINRGGDLERADWLLKAAAKINDHASAPLIERARISARKRLWPEAEAMLDKAQKADPKGHHVFWARGEMFEMRGLIFNAVPEYQKAMERASGGTSAALIDAAIERCTQLIASGAAQEMAKANENAELIATQTAARPQRDPNTNTTRRRRKGGGEGTETVVTAVDPAATTPVEEADGAAGVDGAPVAETEAGEGGARRGHRRGGRGRGAAAAAAAAALGATVEAAPDVVEAAPDAVEAAPDAVEAAPE